MKRQLEPIYKRLDQHDTMLIELRAEMNLRFNYLEERINALEFVLKAIMEGQDTWRVHRIPTIS